MGFVVVASLMIFIAIVIGVTTSKQTEHSFESSCLYDRDTINIMKTYKLINDEEYRLMLDRLEKEKKLR